VRLAPDMDSEATFIRRAESSYVVSIVAAGQPIDCIELSYTLFGDRDQVEYLEQLLADLKQRHQIAANDGGYQLANKTAIIPFHDQPEVHQLIDDVESLSLTEDQVRGASEASKLAKSALVQRLQDFAGASDKNRLACRLQWDAFLANEAGASLDDLVYYLAAYASTQAGTLAQVKHDPAASQPYYLAFFWLVQEGQPVFNRMRGLINPMLNYYWINAVRQILPNFYLGALNSPVKVAVQLANHANKEVRDKWWASTEKLARVNPRLLQRVATQMRLNQPDGGEEGQLTQKIESLLSGTGK